LTVPWKKAPKKEDRYHKNRGILTVAEIADTESPFKKTELKMQAKLPT